MECCIKFKYETSNRLGPATVHRESGGPARGCAERNWIVFVGCSSLASCHFAGSVISYIAAWLLLVL